MIKKMNSMDRVLTALSHKEPDQVPLFLLTTMHGAKELNLSIKEYYSNSKNVVEGQLRLRKKYKSDCLVPFFYAAVEIEAWGGEVIYTEDGPPNSGLPIIRNLDDIISFTVPDVENSKALQKVYEATFLLKKSSNDEVPVIGVAMSPFSLPIMQMGFDKYLDLFLNYPDHFKQLMKINKEFCIRYANAQLKAGATAIAYFDPFSSSTIITPKQYETSGMPIAKDVISNINGPVATHFASGSALPISDLIVQTGTVGIGVSCNEDLSSLKHAFQNKITVLGNLNGIEMRHWDSKNAEKNVKDAIKQAAKGGGFILSDNHGEIPFQVPEDVLISVSEAVQKWGRYPLTWIDKDE